MCTSTQNSLRRDGWEGVQGHCPETPMIVFQFSVLASILGAVAPVTSLLGIVGPIQLPGQEVKANSWLLLVYEINRAGNFSAISVLLPSQSHFSSFHF